MKSAQQILWSSIAILVLLLHLMDAAGTSSSGDELQPKINHRVRRLTGYRTVCVPKKKKFCSMFTYEGVTEMFCIYVDINRCSALDWHLLVDRNTSCMLRQLHTHLLGRLDSYAFHISVWKFCLPKHFDAWRINLPLREPTNSLQVGL